MRDKRTCCVNSCGWKTSKQSISFHRFPKNTEMRERWIAAVQAINGRSWCPFSDGRICSMHFDDRSWEEKRADGQRKLKWGAVPSKFPDGASSLGEQENNIQDSSILDHSYCGMKGTSSKAIQRTVLGNITNSSSSHDGEKCVPPRQTLHGMDRISILKDNCDFLAEHDYNFTENCPVVLQGPDANYNASLLRTCDDADAGTAMGQSGRQSNGVADLEASIADFRAEFQRGRLREVACNTEKMAVLEENKQLKEKLARLEKLASGLHARHQRTLQQNRVLSRKNHTLHRITKATQEKFGKLLNGDQVKATSRRSTRGMKWSSRTIKDALVLRLKCGTTGYEEVRKRFPYPSTRTLKKATQHIPFNSGVLQEVFDMLAIEVGKWKDQEKDCMIAMDEMAIEPGEMIDPSTKSPIGRVTFPPHSGLATKALVFIVGGVSTRWKQVVAFYFTRAKSDTASTADTGKALADILLDIVRRAEAIGLRVHCIVSDMGPDNQSLWREWDVYANREDTKFYIEHPVRPGAKLCLKADDPHVLKSLKSMLVTNEVIELPDDVVASENLSSKWVKLCHLKDLMECESHLELKVAHRLRPDAFTPRGHFQTMRVSNAKALINNRTTTGLQLLAQETQDPEYTTTAWFVALVNRWFTLMANRSRINALSKKRPDRYEEAIRHLQLTIHVFRNMRVGAKQHWKPVQTGVILSTSAILFLQDYFLNERGYEFLLTARFSQDFLENLFSSVRARQCTPHALAFKNILRVVSFAQYCSATSRSCYDLDDGELAVDFLSIVRDSPAARIPKQRESNILQIHQFTDRDVEAICSWEKFVIYDLAGAVVCSLKKVYKVCDICYKSLLWNNESEAHPYALITKLNEYTPEALTEVSDECFRAVCKAELTFRKYREALKANSTCNVYDVLVESLMYVWDHSTIPKCHDVTTKVLRRFFTMRWNQHGQKARREAKEVNKAYHSSKTMAMHHVVK